MKSIHWLHRVRSRVFPNADTLLTAFYLILVSAVVGLSTPLPRSLGNIIVLAAVAAFAVVAIGPHELRRAINERRLPTLPVRTHPTIALPVVALWIVFAVGLVLNPSLKAFLRAGVFVPVSAVALFIVPATVSRREAFTAIGVVGAGCVLLSLPPILFGDLMIADISIDWAGNPLRRFGIVFHVPSLIFDSLNYFRVLASFGAVAAGGVYARTRERWLLAACGLNAFGVFVTVGRAAYVAVIVAVGLAAIYRCTDQRTLVGVLAAGIAATALWFAVALGIVPGPTTLARIPLGGRIPFYEASIAAVAEHPILGWGLVDTQAAISGFAGEFRGVHNSYLRLFVIGGVVGGVAYLTLCAAAVVGTLRSLTYRTPLALTAICLLVMGLLFQLFAGGTIFGTSLSSILWALTIGYADGDNTAAGQHYRGRGVRSDARRV